MTPERWARLKELFEAVLETPQSRRGSFIAEACGSDAGLRADLETLIAAHERAGRFLAGTTETVSVSEDPEPAFAVGAVLAGRYRVVSFLGRGGMGEVYQAWDKELRQHVAVKMLRAGACHDAKAIERLRIEIQNGRRVTHHNVCRIFDLAKHDTLDGELLLLTMELVEGETLTAKIRRDGPVGLPAALDLARQMADALDAAHGGGVIHRDFKSANIMLAPAPDGRTRVVVTDFGLARSTHPDSGEASLTASGMVAGTPGYMSPEQVAGGSLTFATDIYSYGVVLAEMTTGKLPGSGRISRVSRQRAWSQSGGRPSCGAWKSSRKTVSPARGM